MEIRRVGLIGLGKHGSRYARHVVEDYPDLALTAVARRDGDALRAEAARLGARPFERWQDLVESGAADVVISVVPPALHLDIVRACAAARLPLLLEKPVAPDLEAARAMAAVAEHGPPVMVAQTLRYNAVVRALRAHVAAIGPIRSISLTQRFEPSSLGWLDDPELSGAGIALHTGVHCFDLVHFLTGSRIVEVSCQLSRVHTERTEDNCAVAARLDDGETLVTVSLARTTTGRTGHIELAGESGTLVADHVWDTASLLRGRTAEAIETGGAVPTVREIVGDFVRCLRADEPMPITLADGLAAAAVCFACLESAETGKRARVESIR